MHPPIFGREYELAQIAASLARSKAENVPATIRLLGQSGIGKSALLEAACAAAAPGGWLCVSVRCHEIQAKLPLAGGQRLAQSILAALGDAKERYASETLERALVDSREGFDEAFRRLVDGVSLDYALLLGVDDAQWLDAESSALIDQTLRAFAGRTMGLLAAERTGAGPPLDGWLGSGLNLRVEKLPQVAAAEIVRAHYPHATPAVVEAIVAQASAHPIDLVTLAQAAKENAVDDPRALTASVRIVLARQLDAMAPAQREFLQICALIAEPISYHILSKIWTDEPQLVAHIEQSSGRYLVQDGDGLRFAHVSIAESIRQTMPIEIPYRRRILAALLSIERPSLDDYAAVVAQAAACGDAALEYDYLLKLGDEASAARAFITASDAYERALAIHTPPPENLISFYRMYALALANQARMTESAAMLRRALQEAAMHGVPNAVGVLATQLIASIGSTEGTDAAHETYLHYLQRAADDHDRMLLHSIGSWTYVCRGDAAQFELLKNEVLGANGGAPPEAGVRLFACESLLHSRMGEYPKAVRSLERARLLADAVSSSQRMTTDYSRGFIEFFQFGLNAPHGEARREGLGDPMDSVRVLALLSAGDWDDARAFVNDSMGGRRTTARPQVLAVDAAIAVLTKAAVPHAQEIREELRGFTPGSLNDVAVPLAAWWAAALAKDEKREAAALLRQVLDAVASPLSPFALRVPMGLVIAAHRLEDRAVLARLAEMRDVWCDRNPWNIAHHDLAMGLAQTLHDTSKSAATLENAAHAFDQMGAPFFAAYARASAGRGASSALELLAALGVTELLAASPAAAKKAAAGTGLLVRPTARERQVAALVAAGNSNREIAEQLVLSERTIEAHLSNLFNKVGVSSRTQLAAWYYSA